MWTINFIRSHLNRIADDTIFSTRDMLCYGTRSAVDSALHRLVKRRTIIRLARGVFVKWSASVERGELPAAKVVAQVKARGFGKEIFAHKVDAAHQLGLVETGNSQPLFATFGRTTSFQFGEKRIIFRHVAPKDAKLGDAFISLMIRALRYIGPHGKLPETVFRLMSRLNKNERQEVALAVALMPSWLSDLFCSEKIAVLRIKNLSAA